ncbi:MAG: GNAT family N-acetyltransferase [Candidatus Bathyarchaeia archaeon]
MSKIFVRGMSGRDLAEVSELAPLANPHAIKEEYKKRIIKVLEENPDLSFVAVMDGRVIGYVQAGVCGSTAVIEDLAVGREYQGRGVGEKLLRKELEVLRRKDVRLVFAEVHYRCASAIPFYYKFGFRIAGFQQDYFGVGHDAIILKLEL